MVTRATRFPALGALASRLRPAVLALAAAACLLLPTVAAAQTGTLYFLTVKRGLHDVGDSGDTLFDTLEQTHGPLTTDREVDAFAFELDIYGVARNSAGLGLGVEVLGYNQAFFFADGEKLTLDTKGVLFTLKAFLRYDGIFPFVGAGIGNYYVNYGQTSGLNFRDSPDDVFTTRIGVRALLGRLGLLLEVGRTNAELPVLTGSGPATLELGGPFANVGLSWVF